MEQDQNQMDFTRSARRMHLFDFRIRSVTLGRYMPVHRISQWVIQLTHDPVLADIDTPVDRKCMYEMIYIWLI